MIGILGDESGQKGRKQRTEMGSLRVYLFAKHLGHQQQTWGSYMRFCGICPW